MVKGGDGAPSDTRIGQSFGSRAFVSSAHHIFLRYLLKGHSGEPCQYVAGMGTRQQRGTGLEEGIGWGLCVKRILRRDLGPFGGGRQSPQPPPFWHVAAQRAASECTYCTGVQLAHSSPGREADGPALRLACRNLGSRKAGLRRAARGGGAYYEPCRREK